MMRSMWRSRTLSSLAENDRHATRKYVHMRQHLHMHAIIDCRCMLSMHAWLYWTCRRPCVPPSHGTFDVMTACMPEILGLSQWRGNVHRPRVMRANRCASIAPGMVCKEEARKRHTPCARIIGVRFKGYISAHVRSTPGVVV